MSNFREPLIPEDVFCFCDYCKSSISLTDDYVTSKGGTYHTDCYTQMHTYYESFAESVGKSEENI